MADFPEPVFGFNDVHFYFYFIFHQDIYYFLTGAGVLLVCLL